MVTISISLLIVLQLHTVVKRQTTHWCQLRILLIAKLRYLQALLILMLQEEVGGIILQVLRIEVVQILMGIEVHSLGDLSEIRIDAGNLLVHREVGDKLRDLLDLRSSILRASQFREHLRIAHITRRVPRIGLDGLIIPVHRLVIGIIAILSPCTGSHIGRCIVGMFLHRPAQELLRPGAVGCLIERLTDGDNHLGMLLELLTQILCQRLCCR